MLAASLLLDVSPWKYRLLPVRSPGGKGFLVSTLAFARNSVPTGSNNQITMWELCLAHRPATIMVLLPWACRDCPRVCQPRHGNRIAVLKW